MEQIHRPHAVLKIDAHAYSVALTIARLAGAQECMFLLLGEAGPNVVRHVLLLPDQQVTPCSCNITARSMSAAIAEIEQLNTGREPKWVVLGWGHSHGHLDTFHSATDIRTSDDLTAQIGFANRWVREEQLSVRVTEAGDLSVSLAEEGDEVELRTADPLLAQQLARRNVQAVRRITTGFAYSLVVNARGDTYAEVITQPLGAPYEQTPMQRHPATVQVLPEPLDEAALYQEIERKLCPMVMQPPALLPQPMNTNTHPALSLTHICWAALRGLPRRGGDRHD
jgi:proteasome lid subunit RPN8/RPN11